MRKLRTALQATFPVCAFWWPPMHFFPITWNVLQKWIPTRNRHTCPCIYALSRGIYLARNFSSLSRVLTIAGDEPSVVCAFLVELAPFGRSFTGRSLRVEVVFVKGALRHCGVQGVAVLLERTPRLLPISRPFVGEESGAVFGVTRLECPERVRLVIPTLRHRRAIIWIHGCHITVWNARLGVHS